MSSDQPGRVVDQAAIQLLDGHAGLHEIGVRGAGQVVALIDSGVVDPRLEPYVVERLRRSGAGSHVTDHGEAMARAIVQAAPDCRLQVVDVFDRSGLIDRRSVSEGLIAVSESGEARVVNVSLEIRRLPARCRVDRPCVACEAASDLTDRGRLVVCAGGNFGPAGVACPGAARGVVGIAATTGPTGTPSSQATSVKTETGTSVAAAMISGGSALLFSAFPTIEAARVREALAATATRMPNATAREVGAGRAHFFRAFRYIEHVEAGGVVDEDRAEQAVQTAISAFGTPNAATTLFAGLGQGSLPNRNRSELLKAFHESLRLCPWSSRLHLGVAILLAPAEPSVALLHVTEALRLEWGSPEAHDVLAAVLAPDDAFGAEVELRIAERLRAGEELDAAQALFEGLDARATADRTGAEPGGTDA